MQARHHKQRALWGLILVVILSLSMAGVSQEADAAWRPAIGGLPGSPTQAAGKIGPITVAAHMSDGAPAGPADNFGGDTERIFVFFDYDVSQVSDGDVLTTVWYRDGQVVDRRGGPMSELLDNIALLALMTGSPEPEKGHVWMMWPDGEDAMKPGRYRVEMGLDGQTVQTAEFTVGEPAGSSAASSQPTAGTLGEITFARGESGGDPKDPTDRFDTGAKKLYAFFEFTDVPRDAVISGEWYQGGLLLFKQTATLSQVFQGMPPKSGTLWFYLNQPLGSPPGNNRLDLSVDGQLEQSGQFVVAPRDKNPTLANVAFTAMTNGTGVTVSYPISATASYPAGTSSVNAVFDYFGMGPKVKWGWQLSREGTVVEQAKDLAWDGNASGVYALPLRVPNEPGVYDLDLFANGKWAQAGNFILGEPSPSQDRVLQSDDFSSPDSGWGTEKSPYGRGSFDEGHFRLVSDEADRAAVSTSGQAFSDGVIEVEATPLNVPSGTRDDSYGYYGIVARYQDEDNYYGFLASPAGTHGVFHLEQGRPVWDLRPSQAPVSLIPSGFQTNQLRLLARGAELRFYVNGRLVDTLLNPRWTEGQAGVLAAPAGGSPATFAFDNWRVWAPEGAAAAPQAPAVKTDDTTVAVKKPAQPESKPAIAGRETGIRLEVAPWVPQRDAAYGWWGVVVAGDTPDKLVQKTNSEADLILAPGQYDVYWNQDYGHQKQPLLLAAGVEVEDNQLVTIGASSGIKLEVAPWVPQRDTAYGWWGVVLAGDKPVERQRVQWTNADDAVLVAPGTYDVYWNQDYDHQEQPLLLAAGIEVKDNELTDVVANSGVKLEVAPWVPQRDKAYGWWGVVLAGDKPGERQRLQWTNADDALLVVPGTYDVYWNQDYDHQEQPLLLAAGIEVKDNELTSVEANSGVKLEVASWVPQRDKAYGWWGVVLAGDKPVERQRIQWTNADDVLLVVPGTYDVYWNQDYDHQKQPLLLATGIEVGKGESAAVSATSGLKLTLPARTPPLDATYGWWGVVPAGGAPDKPVQWAKSRFDEPLLVLPGTYDIVWKQDYEHPPQAIASGVEVEVDKLTEVPVQPPGGSAGHLRT